MNLIYKSHAGKNTTKQRNIIHLTQSSCTRWSSGHRTEHSIANAYVDAILKAKHFIYIENQVSGLISVDFSKSHETLTVLVLHYGD